MYLVSLWNNLVTKFVSFNTPKTPTAVPPRRISRSALARTFYEVDDIENLVILKRVTKVYWFKLGFTASETEDILQKVKALGL